MAQYKVVVLGLEDDPLEIERDELSGVDCEIVPATPESEGEAMEAVRDADAILLRGPWGTEQVINATEHCQVLTTYSHGFNNIDVDACTAKGIIFSNSAGMCQEEVSNQAVAMVLALNRKLVQYDRDMRAGIWSRAARLPIHPLDKQTLGLVGLGNINRAVARKMSGWRMETLTHDPYLPPWIATEYNVEQVHELNELCARSDYVVVNVPLNRETHHMMGENQFRAMRETAFFVNTCRGPVHDEAALTRALREGWIAGAGLDVFEQEPTDPENPLLKMDQVIAAPHAAGASTRSAVLSRHRAAQQVAAVLRGQWPMAGQNPEVRANIPPRSNARVTV